MILTINDVTFTLEIIMQLGRKQERLARKVATTCRGASFCGYFSGISGSGRPMTHLPARSEWLVVADKHNDGRGG